MKNVIETVEEVKLVKITHVKMKIVINVGFLKCVLGYPYQFLQLILELLLIMFIHNVFLKKMFDMLTLILALKQQFTKHINGKNQTN